MGEQPALFKHSTAVSRGLIGAFTSGITPALQKLRAPVFTDGRNVILQPDGVLNGKSVSIPFATTAVTPIRGFGQQLVTTGPRLFYGTVDKLYRWEQYLPDEIPALGGSLPLLGIPMEADTAASTLTVVGTGYTGVLHENLATPATLWSFIEWGAWMLATNGVNPTQVYKGASFAALAGTTFSYAKILLKIGPHVLAFNTSNGGSMVEWCSADNVELWTPGNTNSAGNYLIRDMESAIICAKMLGDRIAIYGADSLYIASYIGAPFYFGILPALTGIGAVSMESVASAGRKNFGLGQQGFFETDGVSYKYIDDPDVKSWFFARVNWAQKSKICAYHNEVLSRIEWFYPTTTNEPAEGLAYDYEKKAWVPLSYGRTAVIERKVFDYALSATDTGLLYFENVGNRSDGYVVTKPLSLGDEGQNKYVDYIIVTADVALNMEVGTHDRVDGAITWTTPYAVGGGNAPAYVRLNARWFTLRFSGTGAWKLSDFALYGSFSGGFA